MISIILGGSVHTVNKNTEALIGGSEQTGLAVNADEAKHMVMSCNQHAGQNRSITIGHESSERVEQVKYLGSVLTNETSIQEEIKWRLKSECLLSFGTESFVFVLIFACCFV